MISEKTNSVSASNEAGRARQGSGYVGLDRRSVADGANPTIAFAVASACIIASLVLSVFLIRISPARPDDRLIFAIVFATTGSVLAIAGSILCFARFRLIHERVSLGTGVILLLIGAGWLVPARVGPMLRLEWRDLVGGYALGSAAMICAVVASLAFLPNVDSRLTVARHVSWAALGVVVLGTVIAVGLDDVTTDGLLGPALGQVLAGPLLGLAAAVLLILGYRRQRGILAYVGLGLLGLEAAELLAIRAESIDDAWWLSSTIVSVAAASTALYGVIVEYRQGFETVQARLFESWVRQQNSERNAEWQRQKQEETFHDLRAGLLGVEAAALSGALRTAATDGVLAQELARLRELTVDTPGELEAMDVVTFVESIVELRLRQGEAVTLDAPKVLVLETSPGELAEILFNLLDNAARHAPRSPVVLSVVQKPEHVEFRVKDRGPGIPTDQFSEIFKRGVTNHGDGSGLGLYISNQIVKRLGGDLTVEKRVGGGCQFTFSLPTFSATSDEGDSPSSLRPDGESSATFNGAAPKSSKKRPKKRPTKRSKKAAENPTSESPPTPEALPAEAANSRSWSRPRPNLES